MTLSEERLREMLAKMEDSRPHEHVATAAEAQSMARELLSIRSDAHTSGEVKRNAALEEAAKLIEANQETMSETSDGSRRHMTPRKAGNLNGIGFAAAIRALSLGHPIQGEAAPDFYAVWSGTMHIGTWPNKEHAQQAAREIESSTIVPLWTSPQPPTPAGVREITEEIPVPRQVVEIARDLITLYGRNPEWTHVADELSAALVAAKGAGE